MDRLTKAHLTDLTYQINGAAMEVFKTIGPGMLEKLYSQAMEHELKLRGFKVQTELPVSIPYKGIFLPTTLRADQFVNSLIVLEFKACEDIHPKHKAQLFTYMKWLRAPKGILYNFNEHKIYPDGQHTMVNDLYWELPDN